MHFSLSRIPEFRAPVPVPRHLRSRPGAMHVDWVSAGTAEGLPLRSWFCEDLADQGGIAVAAVDLMDVSVKEDALNIVEGFELNLEERCFFFQHPTEPKSVISGRTVIMKIPSSLKRA